MTEKVHAKEGSDGAPEMGAAPPSPAARATRRIESLLSGRARDVVAVLCVVLTIGGIVRTLLAFRAKPARETLVHLRDAGGGVPIYLGVDNDERIHWLEAGALVHLGDANPKGKNDRCLIFVGIENNMTVCGYVDRKDLVAADLARVTGAP